MPGHIHRGTLAVIWAAVATLSAFPQPESGPAEWRAGVRFEQKIAASAVETLRVPIPQNYFVRIEVVQKGNDLIATLRDPRGGVMIESDSDNYRFGPETVVGIAAEAGDYGLMVRNSERRAGDFEVRVAEWRPAVAADRDVIAAHLHYAKGVELAGKHTADARRQAVAEFSAARDFFGGSGNRYMHGLSLFSLGAVRGANGEFRDAQALYEECAGIFRAIADAHMEASCLNNLSGAFDVLGDTRKAQQGYRQALAAVTAIGDRGEQGRILNNIAVTERELADWNASLRDLREALGIVRETGDKSQEAIILNGIGIVYRRLGDNEQALDYFSQSLPLRQATGDKRGEANTLHAMADVERSAYRPDKALELIGESMAQAKALGDRRLQARGLELQGLAYADLKQTDKAESVLTEGLGLARGIPDRERVGEILTDLGQVSLLAGHPEKAADWSAEAVHEYRVTGNTSLEAVSLEVEARAENARGNRAEARRLIEEALKLDEETRQAADSEQLRASFFAMRQDAYALYIDLLMRSGEAVAAINANERARARSLIEMLADARAEIRAGADPALLEKERAISDLLNAKGTRLLPIATSNSPLATQLTSDIRALESEYQEVQAEIRKSSPKYAALTQPRLLTADRIERELLDDDTVLLEYSLGEERSYLWTVQKSGLNSFTLPPRAEIEAQVGKVLQLTQSRADASLTPELTKLSGMLLRGMPLPAGKRLVIVPDGALQNLPFAMLPEEASGKPLLVRHEVVTEPSASALSAMRTQVAGRRPAPRLVAVFADPVFGPDDPRAGGSGRSVAPVESSRILEHVAAPGDSGSPERLRIPRLPYTAQEADGILAAARGGSNLKAVGFQASREKALSGQLSDFRYLHFATHGYLDTERPALSALVLSQIDAKGHPEDGFLRVNDIYNARLSADLAVLSACQTGLGKEVRGEGLMGLTRAFLYAGVPRVVVSLWNVNDRATAILMASFYRSMLHDGKRPSAALRAAQLELRKNKRWESPFYWAAFQQQGEWQ